MKKRDFILSTLIFLLLIAITSDVVLFQLTGKHVLSTATHSTRQTAIRPVTCSQTPLKQHSVTPDPQLKAIPEFEAACKSSFVDQMMIFTDMPASDDDATHAATAMAARLKEFDKQHVTPLIVAEPDSSNGLIDFHQFAIGKYDTFVTSYFQSLKSAGITDTEIGTWIPFPEPQQPYWNNNADPDDYANSVNRYLTILRRVYPNATTAILLDIEVNKDNNVSQLLAYTRLLDNSLVSIAGVQGFPWYPPSSDDERKPITSADNFLPAKLVEEVAKSVGTKRVLFNTGTYRHRKQDNGGNSSISTPERAATLASIVSQARLIKKDGYALTVNVFAQDKLATKEGIDWSYWQAGAPNASSHTSLFTHFIHDLVSLGAGISIYDARP